MTCACAGRGLVRVTYDDRTGPIDIGICLCLDGRAYRAIYAQSPQDLARFLGVDVDHLWLIDELADDAAEIARWGIAPPLTPTSADFTEAGKSRPKL